MYHIPEFYNLPFSKVRRFMFKNIFHDINTMFRNYKYISHGQRLMWIIWVNEGSRGKVTLYLLSRPQCLEVRPGKMVLSFDNLLELWEL